MSQVGSCYWNKCADESAPAQYLSLVQYLSCSFGCKFVSIWFLVHYVFSPCLPLPVSGVDGIGSECWVSEHRPTCVWWVCPDPQTIFDDHAQNSEVINVLIYPC